MKKLKNGSAIWLVVLILLTAIVPTYSHNEHQNIQIEEYGSWVSSFESEEYKEEYLSTLHSNLTGLSIQSINTTSNLEELKKEIYENLKNRRTSFNIQYIGSTSNLKNDLNKIIDEIFSTDHYLYGSMRSWGFGYSGYINDVTINFIADYHNTKAQEVFVDSEVNRILQEIINSHMTDFQKIKAINDYIVLNSFYSFDTSNGVSPHAAYALLKEGKGVCQAYALLAYKMIEQLNIEVLYVTGDAGEPHAWNLVKVDGSWYHLDTTWNDPLPDRKGSVRYNYFLVSDDYISKDHFWDKSQYPKAVNNKYSYMHNMIDATTVGNTIYYSNDADSNALYKINVDGSYEQKLTGDRAYYIAATSDWIYFSNYSHLGYLYKVKADGSSQEQVNTIHSTNLYIEDEWLIFTDASTRNEGRIHIGKQNSYEEPQGIVVIKYCDTEGNELLPTEIYENISGKTEYMAKEIEGYILLDTQENKVSFTIIEDNQNFEHTFVYAQERETDEEDWVEFEHQLDIPNDKTWTILFNSPINFDILKEVQSIYITNEDNNIVETLITPGDTMDTVQIGPNNNYESGKTYTLWIKNVMSLDNKELENNIKMYFTIR